MLKNIILEQEYNMPEVKYYFICPLRISEFTLFFRQTNRKFKIAQLYET